MRWSWLDLEATPEPVVDDVVRWIQEIAEASKKAERERQREQEKQGKASRGWFRRR